MAIKREITIEEMVEKYRRHLLMHSLRNKKYRKKKQEIKTQKFMEYFKAKYG